jgi:hypothetical protein
VRCSGGSLLENVDDVLGLTKKCQKVMGYLYLNVQSVLNEWEKGSQSNVCVDDGKKEKILTF